MTWDGKGRTGEGDGRDRRCCQVRRHSKIDFSLRVELSIVSISLSPPKAHFNGGKSGQARGCKWKWNGGGGAAVVKWRRDREWEGGCMTDGPTAGRSFPPLSLPSSLPPIFPCCYAEA